MVHDRKYFDLAAGGALRMLQAAHTALPPERLRGLGPLVVTGGRGFLGRFITETAARNGWEVVVWDAAPRRPAFLDEAACRRVVYRTVDVCRPDEVDEAMRRDRPAVVVHAAGVCDPDRPYEVLHAVNAVGLANVCAAARAVGTCRVVHLGHAAAPDTPYERSLAHARRLAAAYHDPCGPEVVALQLAPVYGPGERWFTGPLFRMILLGFLPAAPESVNRPVTVLGVREAAAAALVVAGHEGPLGTSSLAAAQDSVPLGRLLSEAAAALDPERLFGVKIPLARLFGLSYQEDLRMSSRWIGPYLDIVSSMGREWTRLSAGGPTRFDGRAVAAWLENPPNVDSRPLRDLTGWQPESPLADLSESLAIEAELGWQLARTDEAEPASGRVRIASARVERLAAALRSFDAARVNVEPPSVVLPGVEWDIDLRSLYILVAKGRSLLWSGGRRAGFWRVLAGGLPDALELLGRGLRARLGSAIGAQPTGGPGLSQLAALWRGLHDGEEGPGKWLDEVFLAETLERVGRLVDSAARILPVIPELRYGFLLESELGAVPMVIEVASGKVEVTFPRRALGEIRGPLLPERFLVEFRRRLKLDFAASAPLDELLDLYRSDDFVGGALARLGDSFLVTSPRRYIALLRQELFRSDAGSFLFVDRAGRILFGLELTRGAGGKARIGFCDEETVDLYDRVATRIGLGGLERLLDACTGGSRGGVDPLERSSGARIVRIRRTRKILKEIVHPGAIARLVDLFERRRARRNEKRT